MTTTPKHEAERLAGIHMNAYDWLMKGEIRKPMPSPLDMAMTAEQLRRIPALEARVAELEARHARILKAAEEAHGPGAFRFKMSLDKRGTASNVFPQWLDQRWVSFVYAEDDAHMGLHARLAELEAQRVALTDEQIEAIRGAVQYCESGKVPDGWTMNRLQEILDAHHGIGTKEGGEG